MRPLAACRGLDVGGRRLEPSGGRFMSMESGILVAVEQVEHGARHAGEAAEVAHGRRVDVDAAQAAEHCLHGPDASRAAIEASGTAAKPGKQMEMADFAQFDSGAGHVRHVTPSQHGETGSGADATASSEAPPQAQWPVPRPRHAWA